MRGKRNWLSLGFLLILLISLAVPAAAVEIAWQKDFQAALGKAKADKRPILLDFFNPN